MEIHLPKRGSNKCKGQDGPYRCKYIRVDPSWDRMALCRVTHRDISAWTCTRRYGMVPSPSIYLSSQLWQPRVHLPLPIFIVRGLSARLLFIDTLLSIVFQPSGWRRNQFQPNYLYFRGMLITINEITLLSLWC